jgi:hypothetical protein
MIWETFFLRASSGYFISQREGISILILLQTQSDYNEFYLGVQNLLCDMGVVCNVNPVIIILKPGRMSIH